MSLFLWPLSRPFSRGPLEGLSSGACTGAVSGDASGLAREGPPLPCRWRPRAGAGLVLLCLGRDPEARVWFPPRDPAQPQARIAGPTS